MIIMDQNKTPLYDRLVLHASRQPVSLHVPGHKYGLINGLNGEQFFREIAKIDVTELSGLDDLHEPEGVILEAEALLAEAYGAEKSFFLVNGSTVGNLAMILGTLRENELVFVQRNCHKSVLNGVQLAKAKPVFLGPEVDENWGIAGGVSLKTVQEAFEAYPDCRAMILTYPNYYGMVNDLKEIIEFAHLRKVPVLIDEAHGAHFAAGDLFPPSALELGADVVVQSAHKTLPAMTMGSFLHVNSALVSATGIEKYLRILQSSSPSYPIMASLDLARKYMATYLKEDQVYLKRELAAFKNELRKIDGVKLLEFPEFGGDPLKVTIQSETNLTGYQLLGLLEEKGIFAELADPYNVLFVLPLLKEGMSFPFMRVAEGIRQVLKESSGSKKDAKRPHVYFQKEKISVPFSYENLDRPVKMVPLEEAENYLCGEHIIPYPPGVPFLLRGERINARDLEGLLLLKEAGARFQGGSGLSKGYIKVFC